MKFGRLSPVQMPGDDSLFSFSINFFLICLDDDGYFPCLFGDFTVSRPGGVGIAIVFPVFQQALRIQMDLLDLAVSGVPVNSAPWREQPGGHCAEGRNFRGFRL